MREMQWPSLAGVLTLLALLLVHGGPAFAGPVESLETLVMPGEVIQGHAKYEKQCEKCHEPFSQNIQNNLCLDCHKEVARDVKERTGFHGQLAGIDGRACKTCHTEHKGRSFNVVGLDRENFNHGQTDYPLSGAHTKADCADCHKPKKKFREAPHKCIDCHKDDDAHDGKLGEKCDGCHNERSWKRQQFDHDKTKFPLAGKHKEVDCKICHPDQHFKETPTDCYSCHKINDVHGGSLGQKCDKCHNTSKWKEAKFDHNKDTDFKLLGAHQRVKCAGCHKDSPFTEELQTTCYSCHKKDDEHKGKNGLKCESCHNVDSWVRTTFDHDKTKFKLRHKHQQVECIACHKGNVYEEKLKTNCFSCHKKDDVHKTQEGEKCERCHNDEGWKVRVQFSHELTRFALLGLHAVTPCEECHLTASYKDAELDCWSCHQSKDVHKRSLGKACEKCHNPNGWLIWEFDHNKQTKFKLDGAHEKLPCKECHKDPVEDNKKIEMPKYCYGCHQKDDVHHGSFGQNCGRCHVTTTFSDFRFRFR
jgi:Zn finger protein HypA/HybF involved in hydrogenase expression